MFEIKLVKKGKFFNKPYRDGIVEKMLLSSINESLLILDREVKKRAPVFTGTLRRSIGTEVRGRGINLKGIVGTPLKYATTKEMGRSPGTFPNYDALQLWVRRKTGLTGKALELVTITVGRNIKRFGIKGKFMFRDALAASEAKIKMLFDRYGFKVVRALE